MTQRRKRRWKASPVCGGGTSEQDLQDLEMIRNGTAG